MKRTMMMQRSLGSVGAALTGFAEMAPSLLALDCLVWAVLSCCPILSCPILPPPGLSIPHIPYIFILYPCLLGLSCPILASAYPAIPLVFLYPLGGLVSYTSYQFLLGLDIPMKLLKDHKTAIHCAPILADSLPVPPVPSWYPSGHRVIYPCQPIISCKPRIDFWLVLRKLTHKATKLREKAR